jgi:hypothetical protein
MLGHGQGGRFGLSAVARLADMDQISRSMRRLGRERAATSAVCNGVLASNSAARACAVENCVPLRSASPSLASPRQELDAPCRFSRTELRRLRIPLAREVDIGHKPDDTMVPERVWIIGCAQRECRARVA